jgi:uncharacterized membrane protein
MFDDISGDISTIIMLFFIFILILFFDNSTQKLDNFQLNYKTVLLSAIAFMISILSINKVSEFIYFNF